jgi:hypothetical protein
MIIGPSSQVAGSSSTVVINVGTEEAGTTAASHYVVDPSPDNSNPWINAPLPEDASKVVDVQPVKNNAGQGTVILFERPGERDSACTIELTDPASGHRLGNIRMLTNNLGKIRSVFSNLNPWG